jgi:hypothetical protein
VGREGARIVSSWSVGASSSRHLDQRLWSTGVSSVSLSLSLEMAKVELRSDLKGEDCYDVASAPWF